jgi:hypothetical protein
LACQGDAVSSNLCQKRKRYEKPQEDNPRALPTALCRALATFACGRLTRLYGERTYLAVAGVVLAFFAAALKRRIVACA